MLYYPSSETKGADQLRGHLEADMRLCFAYVDCWFSHDAAHIHHKLTFKSDYTGIKVFSIEIIHDQVGCNVRLEQEIYQH